MSNILCPVDVELCNLYTMTLSDTTNNKSLCIEILSYLYTLGLFLHGGNILETTM